jgi:oxygen-independent coproporphyrinogen-3 oxidase
VKYWLRSPTLGLGVSSHELWAGRRRANVSNLEQYLAALAAGRRPVALDEPVGAAEVAREEIFLGLRLSSGVPLERVAAFVVGSQDVRLWNDYEGWLSEGILERSGVRVRFTERGFLVSNEVLSRFV